MKQPIKLKGLKFNLEIDELEVTEDDDVLPQVVSAFTSITERLEELKNQIDKLKNE
jgi:hypothetical protein